MGRVRSARVGSVKSDPCPTLVRTRANLETYRSRVMVGDTTNKQSTQHTLRIQSRRIQSACVPPSWHRPNVIRSISSPPAVSEFIHRPQATETWRPDSRTDPDTSTSTLASRVTTAVFW